MKTSRIFITSLLNEAVGVLLILAVWAGASLFYPPYIIPSPMAILRGISTFLPVDFAHHLLTTVFRVAAGFLIAFGIGTLSGVIAAILKLNNSLNSLMVALQVVPGTILGVIFLLMFGIGSITPILLVAVLTLPTLAINTVNGLSKRNLKQEEYLKTLNCSRWQTICYSFIPSLVPVIQSNLSLGVSMAVKVVILGEFIGSQDGLGYLLNHARIMFDMKEVFFYLLVLMILTLLYQALQSTIFSVFFRKFYYQE